MSKLRSISTSIWSDPFIEDLSPNEKLLFIYLITNEKTNMLGIYEASNKKIAFETGLRIDMVQKSLKDFEALGKVKRIGNYVLLCNYMKHQNYNTNMKKSAIDIYNKLPKDLKDSSLVIDKSNPSEGFETLLNHYGMVSKIEVELEIEDEGEKETEIIYPFDSDDFKNCWSTWIKYKKYEHKFSYKKKETEQVALKRLSEISKGIEKDAIAIIQQSIANGYKGLFALKNQQTKKPTQRNAHLFQS